MPKFTLRTLMVVMLVVAAFFAGWAVRTPFIAQMQAETLQARANAELAREDANQRATLAEYRALQATNKLEETLANDASTSQTLQGSLKFLSWNVESNGNDPATISKQLVALSKYDVYVLQEVHPANAASYGDAIRNAKGEDYHYILGNAGRSDRLMLIYDASKLSLQSYSEMFNRGDQTRDDWTHRPPLVGHFVDNDGFQFHVVTVHLARGDPKVRQKQAVGLSDWARGQSQPVFAIGDFNFDYTFATKQGNESFHMFVDDEVFTWAQPETLVDTNWADDDGDGIDDYPGSCLDFGFHAQLKGTINVETRVVVRVDDFPDDEKTSDHRPIEMIVIGAND